MELPLVLNTKHKDFLKVFAPTDGQPLMDGDNLISSGEDLEKLPQAILVRLYNLANPGVNINALKPGTVVKFCLPALKKLADVQKSTTTTTAPKPAETTSASAPSADQPAAVSTPPPTASQEAPAMPTSRTQPPLSQEPKKTEPVAVKTATAAPSTGAEKKPRQARGSRAAEYLGKTIVPKVSENPRREGTRGHKSMQVVLDHHKNHGYKGITFAKYVELGGRAEDLAWDLTKGSVEIK